MRNAAIADHPLISANRLTSRQRILLDPSIEKYSKQSLQAGQFSGPVPASDRSGTRDSRIAQRMTANIYKIFGP